MSKYTLRDIELAAISNEVTENPITASMLREYIELRRQHEAAKAGVTDEIVDIAMNAFNEAFKPGIEWFAIGMRAALEAVAPMLASARTLVGWVRVDCIEKLANQDFSLIKIAPDDTYCVPLYMLAAAPKPEAEG